MFSEEYEPGDWPDGVGEGKMMLAMERYLSTGSLLARLATYTLTHKQAWILLRSPTAPPAMLHATDVWDLRFEESGKGVGLVKRSERGFVFEVESDGRYVFHLHCRSLVISGWGRAGLDGPPTPELLAVLCPDT